jgi:hypothetical protein
MSFEFLGAKYLNKIAMKQITNPTIAVVFLFIYQTLIASVTEFSSFSH